jgi:hypothetical protein
LDRRPVGNGQAVLFIQGHGESEAVLGRRPIVQLTAVPLDFHGSCPIGKAATNRPGAGGLDGQIDGENSLIEKKKGRNGPEPGP